MNATLTFLLKHMDDKRDHIFLDYNQNMTVIILGVGVDHSR
jgi:hypothetical protein